MLQGAVVTVLLAVFVFYFVGIPQFDRTDVLTTASLNTSYDYVIVGAGSAGSVLASRLSEREDVSVLLLEAGGHYNENPASHVPALFPLLIGSDMDWGFHTEPQGKAMLGMNGRQAFWPRGRTVGGSSVINFLQFARGNRFDFDEWETLGCSGWSYTDVLPYFKKLENIQISELQNSEYRGHAGPIGISDGRFSPLADHYMKAFQEMGVPRNFDHNGQEQEGYGPLQLSVKNGVRSSTSKEYLTFAASRRNLHIAPRTMVSKIKIVDNEARGVYVIRNGKKIFIEARKEVIVSAGAVKSPQLLMLSGIGPKDHLSELGIPLAVDLPVGENLQDHIQAFMFSSIKAPLSIPQKVRGGIWSKLKYHVFGEGPLAKSGVEVTAFFHTDPQKRNKTYTDIQFNMISIYGLPNIFDLEDNVFKTLQVPDRDHGFFTSVILNHPKSEGVLRLRSIDPFDDPLIEPNYLFDKTDIDEFVKGLRIWEQFISTKAMSDIGATIEDQRLPICKMFDFRSDEYWECYVRHLASTGYHPCCTCKMGSSEDSSSVVDSQLRVKGIRKLRVVDASVFPKETSGNTNAPTIMVGEKAADMILEEL